ncbi:hypothetical protein Aperf_G00000093792 [Anoplocephala perfoliata]
MSKIFKGPLWGSPIPESAGMRCNTMDYAIIIGSDELPKPSYVWTFNENMGNWVNDVANWGQKWKLVDGAICLKNISPSPENGITDMPWFALLPKAENKGPKSSKAPIWSPPIPKVAGMRCITMDYNIHVDSGGTEICSLAVLQQQDGSNHNLLKSVEQSLPKPFYVWTFNENMGKWANDASNWNQRWELIDGAICLKNIPTEPEVIEDDMPWFAVKSNTEENSLKSTKALLWSPPIPKSTGMCCITMDYNIKIDSVESGTYSLAVLEQQDGILWDPFRSFLPGASTIFHVWTFDNDLEYWTNDDDIGSQKWLPVPDLHAVCLSAKVPSAIAYDPKRPAWMSESEDNSVDISTDLKARLRSPKIPAKANMQCLAITFGIFSDSDQFSIPGASLAVLERRDRLPLFAENASHSGFMYSVSSESVSGIVIGLSKVSSNRNPLLFPYLELPVPLIIWTFREDLEEWTNDGDNWLQKWKVSRIRDRNLLCLHAKISQRSRQSLLLSGKEDISKSDVQARLLSPLIPSRLSLRCLSLTYMFYFGVGNRLALFACDFESPGSKSFCGWNIDPRDSGAMWSISTDSDLKTKILCLAPSTLPGTYFNGDDFDSEGSDESVMKAKFWSPKFRAAKSDIAPQCIKLSYKFGHTISDQQSSLSINRQSSADLKMKTSAGGPMTQTIGLRHGPPLPIRRSVSNSTVLSLEDRRMIALDITSLRDCLSFKSKWGVKTSFFACDFETAGSRSFCGWKDDPRDNGVSWSIHRDSVLDTNVLCLAPSTLKRSLTQEDFEDSEDDDFGFSGKKETSLRAKLWSPKFRAAKIEAPPQSGPRPSRSPLDCDFNGSSSWMPDPRDSSAKWQIENATMCLHPVILSSNYHSFFSLSSSTSSPKARLWSAEVPSPLSVRCLTFEFSLSPVNNIYLSVLLHSSGTNEALWNSMGSSSRGEVWNTARIDLSQGKSSLNDFKLNAILFYRSCRTFVVRETGKTINYWYCTLSIQTNSNLANPTLYGLRIVRRVVVLQLGQKRNCKKIPDPETDELHTICKPSLLWSSLSVVVAPNSPWTKTSVDLAKSASSDFQTLHPSSSSTNGKAYNLLIILEGVIPAGFPDARICVDNITSYNVSCSELEPKPVKAATATYTWAQYFGITFIIALAFGLLIPILFLIGIIVICRRRHAYRHHHCMTNGSGGGMSVGRPGSGSYGNSKLFSANLWHYIGGKEAADDPFAEHTASIHRPPFATHKFSDGTLGMRGDGTLDLPDVVIPSGRVVGGTLMRQTSQPAYNGAPFSYQTMMTTGKAMRYNGMAMAPPNSMLASQPNFAMDFGNAQSVMQGSQQVMVAPGQVVVQPDAAQQQMMVQPANYFQSLAQPAAPAASAQMGAQPMVVAPAPGPAPVVSAAPVAMTSNAAVVNANTAPTQVNVNPGAAGIDENGPFVLPDPPSDHQQERDQVAAALDALNAATEPPQPRQTASVTAAVNGEHPPPGYDEAVGMAVSRSSAAGGSSTGVGAPVLPPRRTAPTNSGAGEPISLAQRYGLPVAEI